MSAIERGYGGVVGRRAIYTPEEARERSRASWRKYYLRNLERLQGLSRERYRNATPTVKPRNPSTCTACDQSGHNVRTCRNCSRCGKPGEHATNLGRFCQACLVEVAR